MSQCVKFGDFRINGFCVEMGYASSGVPRRLGPLKLFIWSPFQI